MMDDPLIPQSSSTPPLDESGFDFEETEDFQPESLRMEMDPLMVPGALEVEEVPSGLSEVQKENLQSDATFQVREATGSVLSQTDILDVQDESAMGLKELLAEANLGERHLRFCGVALLIGILFVVGVLYWWLKPESTGRVEPERVRVEQGSSSQENVLITWFSSAREALTSLWDGAFEEEEESFLPSEEAGSRAYPSVVVGSQSSIPAEALSQALSETGSGNGALEIFDLSYALGAIEKGTSQDFQDAELLGSPEALQDPLLLSIEAWSKAKNLMDLDVQTHVLSQSNPRKAVEAYLEDLRLSLYHLENERIRLQQEAEALVRQFSVLQLEKEKAEDLYFQSLSDGASAQAIYALQSFIQKGEAIVPLRAHYLARTRLSQNIDRAIPLIEARLQDVEANREAIIRGIKVYDFPKSDLELILDGSSL